jgi:glycosyltransferase involved in cell wall biosynthesis
MNQNSLVSCIIIFLNAGEKFFIEAIESVFAQTYDNWELLLVDDGSTNESSSIAKSYSQQYPEKVIYLEHESHKNLGMSAARNLGINQSKGEYIAFLDADDIWLPEKLEKQVTILENYPQAGMVYGSTLTWYSWNSGAENLFPDRKQKLGVQTDTVVKQPKMIPLFLNHQAETPGTCSVLIRSQLVREVGGFEDAFRGLYEDQVFFYKICLKAPVYVESGCWDKYRQHSNSSCHLAAAQKIYDPRGGPSSTYLKFLDWLKEYLQITNVKDPEIWKALEKEFWPFQHPKLYKFIKLLEKSQRIVKKLIKPYWLKIIGLSKPKTSPQTKIY